MYPTVKDLDYTVSSEEVHFSSGAPDGTESCITISAICDSFQEGNEQLTIFIGSTIQYAVETTGSEYSSFIQIILVENTGIFACIIGYTIAASVFVKNNLGCAIVPYIYWL